ncbi:APC family permease [Fusibacter ferrireducens]|uniref:APC family permease n=1 Tax=Fusibacter ferrireducens TaxID=2785058 RepID=A0ABR9ZQ63_9FIRM|nr:APC family permease [Fusibacter ferrireducens]MBF4692593.1 APC family permease [Fusibacter ferrireducens]
MKKEATLNDDGVLGFTELWALGVGQVIGAGVITLVGPAIGLTGHSAWLAYLIAVVIGAVTNLPIIIFSSVTKYSGGDYSIITMLGGQKIGGMYIVGFSLQTLGLSLFATALGLYLTSMFPLINGKVIGIVFLFLFYAINLMGLANMAKVQKIMSAILIAALLMFIIVGATKADFSQSFSFKSPVFFPNGSKGFWAAVMLLVYSCQGYKYNVNYGGQTKNATKNLPLSMLAVIPVLMVVYTGAALIDSAVLPLEAVAGQPLTLAAKTVLPNALFYAFMFGGPIMALLTTMNSSYAAMVGPFSKASQDGWFPEKLASTNSRGGAYIILTIQLIVGLVPVLLNFSVIKIVSNMMLITSVYNFLLFYSLWQVPRKMPEKWAKATMHTSDGVYYAIIIAAFIVQGIIGWNSIKSLTLPLAIFNIVALLICFIYAIGRHNAQKTHVDTEGMLELI